MDRLRALADYLAHPQKYAALGARLPRGVLLYGPPGTGKTLMARALAGEAGVPFFSLSGSDFVEMYVGVGAARVRELFAKAAKAGRCVIFIDEIDAIGKRRDDSSGSEERDRTLNALLSEMSGFAENSGVIVLAATNRADTLDPALTRPGRFDAKIEIGLPDRRERLDILRLHCRKKPLAEDVDLCRLAADTVRFSGASLESLVNDAAIRAARRGGHVIEEDDLHAAFVAAVAGEDRPVSAAREELAVVALHEAGHAVACRALLPGHRIERLSVLPTTSGAAGYNLTIPAERALPDLNGLTAQIQVLLAGRAAEQLLYSETNLTAGASGDLAQAAELASTMALDLGMVASPAVSLRALSRCTGGAQEGAALVRRLLDDCYQAVRLLLSQRVAQLEALAARLVEAESLTGDEVAAFFEEMPV
ncbi:MAG: AAA family ATPase [Clostridia bacterium]|nr:AAA family ATPase [Clostridia bacterium]